MGLMGNQGRWIRRQRWQAASFNLKRSRREGDLKPKATITSLTSAGICHCVLKTFFGPFPKLLRNLALFLPKDISQSHKPMGSKARCAFIFVPQVLIDEPLNIVF